MVSDDISNFIRGDKENIFLTLPPSIISPPGPTDKKCDIHFNKMIQQILAEYKNKLKCYDQGTSFPCIIIIFIPSEG